MVSSSESGTLTKPALFGRDILRYHRAEDLTGIVIYFMLVFSPWAFGTTQRWSIWVMRGCGYVLGLLLLAKLVIRLRKDYRPARWGGGREEEPKQSAERNPNLFAESRRSPKEVSCSRRSRLNFLLAVLTVCLVLYCLVSALNARGSYNPVLGTFEYRDYLWWLPHSFDRSSTAEAFWSCLALACAFWAIVDWLPGKEPKETRSRSIAAGEPRGAPTDRSPLRLQRLLWVLSLSGGLLAFEDAL